MSIRPRRVAAVLLACAAAIAVFVAIVAQGDRAAGPETTPQSTDDAHPGLRWFVGDGYFLSSIDAAAQPLDGPPADWASSLHVVNPGTQPAHVGLTIYRLRSAPTRSAVEVAPGQLYTIDLARRRDVPRGEPFWVAVDADRPVFPQIVHQTFRPWDIVPEGIAVVPPQAAPLDDSHTSWIYPDAFQGGTARWLEQETITLLNPSPHGGDARLVFQFRDGRPTRTHDVALAAQRVTLVDLAALFPEDGTPLTPALSGDFSITITATRPVVTQQTRRVYWRGRREITSLTTRAPLRRADVIDAREWYYAGGWTRDLDILPRDGQTDRTWHLLFTYPLDGRARGLEVQPSNGAAPVQLPIVPGRSDLQWLHLAPWRETFAGEAPWGFSLRADGPVAPAVTTAEFEPWSQAMPGAMGAGNLVSDAAARRQESWLGVAYHGGADDRPTEWLSAWQLYNPGAAAFHGTLYFHTDDGGRLEHPVTVAPGLVTRVTGDAVPGLPMGRPFVVQAVADRPFAAHAWLRARARGVPTVRAMSSTAGVAVQLAGADATDDGATLPGQ